MNDDSSNQYHNDEINLKSILKPLKERSRFIFGFTGVVTLLTIGYVLSLTTPPTEYKIETSFLKPNESSIIQLNRHYFLNETAESVFSKFLTFLNSPLLKKEVLLDGGYLKRLQQEDTVNITKFIKSISLDATVSLKKKNVEDYTKFELPYILSTETSSPDIISEFLNEVITVADNKTVNSLINFQKVKISNRLIEIATERQLLLAKAYQDRLSQIKRIKEEDNQKLREIHNKIDSARLKAKTERINQIIILTNAAQLAGTLGIMENNLNRFDTGINPTNFNIVIKPGENTRTLPDWYLFGETALLKMIALLQNRVSDDPYIPELVILDNQIDKINNNALLKTLEQRLDDIPFIPEVNILDIEAIKLESISLNSNGISSMRLYQAATSEIIRTMNNNLLTIALAFIASLILSLALVLLMNVFKEEDVTSI